MSSDQREIKGQPSTDRVRLMRDRYLSEPIMIDSEYMRLYTDKHRETDGMHPFQRRAECHGHALENLTPVIRDAELFAGSKTRYVRGAIPYCNYASNYILREFANEKQDEQDGVTDLGTGGGIAKGLEMAGGGEYEVFSQKYLLSKPDKVALEVCAEHFVGKCMQDVGDDLWRNCFPEADYIDKGWQAVLYTAPHDPAPEGRYILDYERVLEGGLEPMVERMQHLIDTADVSDYRSAEKIYFWRAGIRVLEATLRWADNYAAEARRLAASEPDTERRAQLERIAEACAHAPRRRPRSFFEAMQAFWLIYLAGHIEGAQLGYSPGRFDRYMYPFYRASIDNGETTDSEVLELLEMLRVKMTEIEYVASFSWSGLGSGNLYQNMILGGVDENGQGADNQLSTLVVQSAINCQTTQPTLSIWYDDTLNEDFLLKAAECVKTGCGFPAFFNTKIYLQHELQKSRLPLETIRTYAAMGGCTEPVLEGMSYGVVQAGFINHGKIFELALNGGVDPRSGIEFEKTPVPQNYDELMEAYLGHLKSAIRNWQRYWNYVMAAHRNTCNLIFSSVLVRDCVERGLSLDDGGAVCNQVPTTLSTGMVNVANAMAAVRALVEEQGVCTMDELRDAVSADWEGHEALKRKALDAPKWGNDDDRADSIFQNLFNSYCDFVAAQKNFLGEPYDPSMLAISTHTPFGAVCGATPDGRSAGEPLCDGVTSPFPGTDTRGPVAVLHSAGKIDHTRIRGGLHNLKFHPNALTGVAGSHKLLSLVKTYFDTPGFQVQFNVVDSGMLRDAQENPENYRDLIVRVAGFSAFFVELSRSIQDQVIERTEHEL